MKFNQKHTMNERIKILLQFIEEKHYRLFFNVEFSNLIVFIEKIVQQFIELVENGGSRCF